MTGTGWGWSAERQTNEAAKFTLPGEDGWGGFTTAFADEWVAALADGGLTEAQVLDLFMRRQQLRHAYTESAIIDDATLPDQITGDRYFRDAVVWDASQESKCNCDMTKARAIHLEEIRKVRNTELAAKDVTFMRAVEAGDASAQSTIGTEKQVLRDLPATFDITTDVDTPELLKAKWPAELPARE